MDRLAWTLLWCCLCYEGRCSCLAWSRTAATAKVDQISAMQGILKTSGQCFGRAFHPKLDK